jgi:NAD+ synthase (glutamine-hydrolysing)
MRLALAQINSTVGDLAGNTRKIVAWIERARAAGAGLVAFPELAVTGYPPEDLLLKPDFLRANRACLDEIARACRGIVGIVGYVEVAEAAYNAAALLANGALVANTRKERLPNYGVFDEERYFRIGEPGPLFALGGTRFGINVCEDIWYPTGPAAAQAAAGAELIVNINASPYHRGKWRQRERMLATRAWDNAMPVAYVNMVGGQDELVFDGASVVFDERGELVARAKSFEEDLLLVDLDLEGVFRARLHDPRWQGGDAEDLACIQLDDAVDGGEVLASGGALTRAADGGANVGDPRSAGVPTSSRGAPVLSQREREHRVEPALGDVEEVYRALVLGTGDYLRKNGFERVVIGLSGGIDSSLVAAIAVDALGADRVTGVSMPSRYSSDGSKTDAQRLAENLGIRLLRIPVEPAFRAYLEMLTEPFAGTAEGLAEENLQARVRGTILMALSNKFGWLVLTTGNKSEMAVGYATLYGDMAGGFAVIKDVPKTLVYRLCRWRNERDGRPTIPPSVLEKPPSAELRPDQKDEDSLPPYEVLDPILEAYVEQDRAADEIAVRGYDPETVARVIRLVDGAEYKRRQAPPGVKITPRAFGRDRRLPITNRYGQPIPEPRSLPS